MSFLLLLLRDSISFWKEGLQGAARWLVVGGQSHRQEELGSNSSPAPLAPSASE